MPKEEITTGLKNALARNESLEKAVQTLTTAGYSPQAIKEAVDELNLPKIQKIPVQNFSQENQQQETPKIPERKVPELEIKPIPIKPQVQYKPLNPEQNQIPIQSSENKKPKVWLIILIVILVLLLGSIATLTLLGDKILEMFFG